MEPSLQRVTRSKEEARASYNRLSRWYDAVSGSTEKKYRDVGLQKLAARPGERILEIGYGTGHCILALAQAVGENGKVCGIDISDGMQALTQQRLLQANLAERVDLRLGDAAHLPFEAGSFDGVFMSFTLELFDTPEIPQVLAQCRAMLRPTGRLCVVTMIKEAQDGMAVRIYEWFHQRMPAAVDCRPIFAQLSLREASFTIQDVTKMNMWGLPVEIILAHKPAVPQA